MKTFVGILSFLVVAACFVSSYAAATHTPSDPFGAVCFVIGGLILGVFATEFLLSKNAYKVSPPDGGEQLHPTRAALSGRPFVIGHQANIDA